MKNIGLLLMLLSVMSCAIGIDTTLYNNMSNEEKNEALIEASQKGNFKIVKYLVENRADINAKDNDGDTALMMASNDGGNVGEVFKVVKFLVENGADINVKNNDGDTALMMASINDQAGIVTLLDVVKLLLDSGADINAKDKDGDTALMKASGRSHTEIVEYLASERVK